MRATGLVVRRVILWPTSEPSAKGRLCNHDNARRTDGVLIIRRSALWSAISRGHLRCPSAFAPASRKFDGDMLIFLLALAGFALLDSLDVLLVGVTTAVVLDSRLGRRSPVPGGLSFIAGVFAVTTAFGICTVLGLHFLTDLVDFELTPALRFWGELAIGAILVLLGSVRLSAGTQSVPPWAMQARRRPWLLGLIGVGIGLGQAPTAVPYLAALAMISTRDPRPTWWPVIVVVYCAIALIPPALVLFTATSRSARLQRFYRRLVRVMRRFGPMTIRALFLIFGAVLIIDALRNYSSL